VRSSIAATTLTALVTLVVTSCGPALPLPGAHAGAGPPDSGGPYLIMASAQQGTDGFPMVDWSGKVRGTFHPLQLCAPGTGPCFSPIFSPDGTRAVLNNEVISDAGASLGTLPISANKSVTGSTVTQYALDEFVWGDDSRHLCAIGSAGSVTSSPGRADMVQPTLPEPTRLYLTGPGDPEPHLIATLAGGGTTQDESHVLACSPSHGTALTATYLLPGPSRLIIQLIRLSDGAVVATRTYPSGPGKMNTRQSDYVSSVDGRELAENASDNTAVIDVVTGIPMGPPLPGHVRLFSADGQRAALTRGGAGDGCAGAEVVDVRTGRVLWQTDVIADGAKSRPDRAHADLAIGLRDHNVWIVGSDGSSRILASNTGVVADAQTC